MPVSRGRRQQSHVTVSIFKGRSQQEGYKHVCPIFRFNRKGVWCACEQKGSLVLLSRARFSVVPGYALQTGMVPQALAGLTHPRTVATVEVELKIHVLNCLLSGGRGGKVTGTSPRACLLISPSCGTRVTLLINDEALLHNSFQLENEFPPTLCAGLSPLVVV